MARTAGVMLALVAAVGGFDPEPQPRNLTVALAFWGLTRSLNLTFPSIEYHIFRPLRKRGVNFEVFMHTYVVNTPYTNPRTGEVNVTVTADGYKLLNPKYLKIDDQDAFDALFDVRAYSKKGVPWHNNVVSLTNSIRALNSQAQLIEMIDKSGTHFDAVVMLRPDVTYLTDLDVDLLGALEQRTAYLPHFAQHPINDRFVMGRPEVVRVYGARYYVAEAFSQYKSLASEIFLRDYLFANHIRIEKIPFYFQRTRPNGMMMDTVARNLANQHNKVLWQRKRLQKQQAAEAAAAGEAPAADEATAAATADAATADAATEATAAQRMAVRAAAARRRRRQLRGGRMTPDL